MSSNVPSVARESEEFWDQGQDKGASVVIPPRQRNKKATHTVVAGRDDHRTPRGNSTYHTPQESGDFRLRRGPNNTYHTSKESKELHFRRDETRDSMVDNLLLSFNEIPGGEGPYSRNEPLYSSFDPGTTTTSTTKANLVYDVVHQRREHSRNSSTGSDYDLRPSNYFIPSQNLSSSRGPSGQETRSKSKSINSTNPNMDSSTVAPATPTKKGASPANKSRPSSRKGAKHSSPGSGISAPAVPPKSLDEPKPLKESRSSSFDLNPLDDKKRHDRVPPPPGSILNRRRPVPVEYHDFDTSRIPPVPQFPSLNSRSSPSAMNATNSQIKSPVENFQPQTSSRNKVATLVGTDAILAERYQASDSTQQTPRQTSYPTVYGSENTTSSFAYSPPDASALLAMEPAKERQGFFRRVFGSSRNFPTPETEAPQLPPIQSAGRQDQKLIKSSTIQSSSSAARVNSSSKMATEESPVPQGDSPHVVQKKSSFFRRLKKNSEKDRSEGMPPPPTSSTPSKYERSESASSLRQVMDPFLNNQTSPTQKFYDSKERQSADEEEIAALVNSKSAKGAVNASASLKQVLASNSSISRQNTDPASIKSREDSNGPSANQMPDTPVEQKERQGSLTPSARQPSQAESLSPANGDNVSRQLAQQPGLATPTVTTSRFVPEYPPPLSLSIGKLVRTTDEEGIVASPVSMKETLIVPLSNNSDHAVLQRSVSDDQVTTRTQTTPTKSVPKRTIRRVSGSSTPNHDDFESATEIPVLQIDDESGIKRISAPSEGISDPNSPRQEDFDQGKAFFDGYDNQAMQTRASGLLGAAGPAGVRLRRAYMSFYDFSSLNILLALRDLCERLNLRGESQQINRILTSFTERWCDCNPNHGFKSQDIVHTIVYSLVMLNTDLHSAELDSSSRMTRAQFVKNTLPTIRLNAEAPSSSQESGLRPTQRNSARTSRDARSPSPFSGQNSDGRPSLDTRQTDSRLSVRTSNRPTSELPSGVTSPSPGVTSPSPGEARAVDVSTMLVDAPYEGTLRAWEIQVELVLREFYASIRQLRLPLNPTVDERSQDQAPQNNLTVTGMDLSRRGSYSSKTVPDSLRARAADARSIASKWSSKNRSVPKFYQTSTRGSSRTSLDDGSVWSPSGSSTWSKSYFGKGYGSISSDTLATHATQDYGYQQSIGFANALSHAIIREEGAYAEIEEGTTPLLEDDTLELAGAPWAKEGIVQHKHHLETTDKKAKDRNWNECFLVVEKGWMRLFSFNSKASAKSNKNKAIRGAVVGGGNWMENAESVGNFMLRQSIANVLPPPGYAKARPHVFALSLPTGAVHLFHVGTPEIAKEFVSTANYWSARLSKEPLVGGVSNVEYGWSENVVNTALLSTDSSSSLNAPPSAASGAIAATNSHSPKPSASHKRSVSGARPSLQGSLRSSIDLQTGTARAKLPGDKVALSEWKPPQQSLVASSLREEEQLEGLRQYVHDVEQELTKHNELRPGLVLAFSPRHPNAAKAMANWERKSSYLLREIVKFRTYIDSLSAAKVEADKIKQEREERAKEREMNSSTAVVVE